MNRREVHKFFDIKKNIENNQISENEVENLFMSICDSWSEDKGSLALFLLSKYKISYNEIFKKKVASYTLLFLHDPMIINQSEKISMMGPLILMPKFLKMYETFDSTNFFDIIEDIILYSDEEMAKCVFIPIIYECSRISSKYTYYSDFKKYMNIVNLFFGIPKVRLWFKDPSLWGLKNTKIDFDREFTHSAFCYETNLPCFLDGFLEIFIYCGKDFMDSLLDALKNESKQEINAEMRLMIINNSIKMYSEKIYEIILKLIKTDPEIKNNFMKYILMTIRLNKDRFKMVFDRKKVISDGFAYNMNNILLLLSQKIVNQSLFKLIEPKFFERFELEWLEKQENEIVTEKYENFAENEKISFSTVIFTSKILFSELSLIIFYNYLEKIDRRLEELNLMDSHDLRAPGLSEIIEQKRKKTVKLLKSRFKDISSLYNIPFFYKNEVPFVDFMIELANINDFIQFPTNYFSTAFQLQKNILRFPDSFISPSLISLVEKIMGCRSKNPHFKSFIIEILNHEGAYLTENLFLLLMHFYSDIHKLDHYMYEKIKIRYMIHEIMLKDTTQKLADMKPDSVNLKFVNYMIDDFQKYLSDGLDSIIRIKEDKKNLQQTKDEDEIKKLKKQIFKNKDQAISCFTFIDSSFQLILYLIRETIDVLFRPEIYNKFFICLNCNLKTIVGPKCNNLIIENPDEYQFDPKNLLRKILKIYISIQDDKYFEAIVKDQRYYNIALFKRALQIVETKSIFSSNEIEKFRVVVTKLEKIQFETLEEDEIIPDEFLDPITCDPMKDPVLLLTSNIIIDRPTFESIMLSDQIDPFNRENLDETKIQEAVELKNKIKKYWEDKKDKGKKSE